MGTNPTLITGASSDIGCAIVKRHLGPPGRPNRARAFVCVAGTSFARFRPEFGDRLQLLQVGLLEAFIQSMRWPSRSRPNIGTPAEIVHLPALRLIYERFTKFDWNRFETDLAIQVESAVVLLQRFLPKMAKLPRARILFVLSTVVHGVPPKFMSMYTMVKYTQLGLMRALAAEYASTSVRINAISPGNGGDAVFA